MRADCPYCRKTFELEGDEASRLGDPSEDGGDALGVSIFRKCPLCKAGIIVRASASGVSVELSNEPLHPRWSARGLAWAGPNAFAVASMECLGVTIVCREGLRVSLGPELAQCEHHGFDPSGQHLLVDSTPFPRGPGSPRQLAVWSPGSGELTRLAAADVAFEPPMLSRSRSARDAIAWHRGGEHVLAVSTELVSHASLTVWSVREGSVRTQPLPALERGRAWLEPGGDRMLWEEQRGEGCRLVLVRIDPRSHSIVAVLGELARSSPTDVCDVVWQADRSLLVAYVQNEGGLSHYQQMPYGLLRVDSQLRVSADRFPIEPELCPMKPAPCTLSWLPSGDVVFVTNRAYLLDGNTLAPKSVLPTNVRGGDAFRFDPSGEVVAIAGPSDIHIASLSTKERTSLRKTLG
jgi:hypothetical protein